MPELSSVSIRLKQVLGQLNLQTSRDVAARLMEGKFVGERNSLTHCPVALYIRGQVPGEVCVAMDGAWIYAAGPFVPLPPAVRLFIEDFDRGMYPALAAGWEVVRQE